MCPGPEFVWSFGFWWEQITENMRRIEFNWTEEPFIRFANKRMNKVSIGVRFDLLYKILFSVDTELQS